MTSDVQPRRVSLLTPITLPLSIMLSVSSYLLLSIILGTVIDWLGVVLGWWDNNHQLAVLKSDILYLGENFTTSIAGVSPADLAVSISQQVQQTLTFSHKVGGQQYKFMRLVAKTLIIIEPYYQSMVYSAMTVAVRILIITLSTVFFIIVFFVAMIDGLVQRELRKDGGGIERAQVYHHAKTWVGRVLVISPVIYLAYPHSINPNWIVLPAALAFYLAVFITFATFKKYL